MPASKIIIARHGEKPIKKVKGVDFNSSKDDNSLIVRGWQRAGALVQILNENHNLVKTGVLSVPKYLFACYKSKHAQRALDTITPLAQFLGLTVNTSIQKGKEEDLAKAAMACDGTVVVAWELSV